MQALADRLDPYQATRVATGGVRGLWSALTNVVGDASVRTPDPVPDARVDEICAEEAQRAIFSHLATLSSGPAGTGPVSSGPATGPVSIIDLRVPFLRAG